MVTKLFVPDRKIVVPKPPSYLKLDMAFAIGAGAKLMDKSRYRSHGTISGATWADGAHGRCLDFNAATPSYVEIPAAYDQLDFTSEDFSMIFRVLPDTLVGGAYLFTHSDGWGDGYGVELYADGKLAIWTFQAGTNQNSKSAVGSVVAGTQYTLGFSRDGSSVRVYINGVDSTTTVGTHQDPLTSAEAYQVGIWSDKAILTLDGKIEFLRIFGGIALTASEHLAYHNALA